MPDAPSQVTSLERVRPAQRHLARRHVLIVNCYADDSRAPIARTHKVPQAMGPAYLAGAFAESLCEIRLYSELASGPLEDEALLAWPDMIVLTGLTTALDRMLHVTAYARTKNPRVVVVAGGHAVRALPQYCARFFDYACLGDVEELRDVVRDAFGQAYVAEDMFPRFDLASWVGKIGYVEASRYCNFRCSFCTLTGEGRKYRSYPLDHLRRSIEAAGQRRFLVFIDNNFYGNNRADFRAKLALIAELHRAGRFGAWSALVTNDFFFDDENLRLAREAGCTALFSGVESFDARWLHSVAKGQNSRTSPVDVIRKTLEAGILFLYGLMLDVANRSLADLEQEIDAVFRIPGITLPSYVSVSIPILGTPFFHQCHAEDRLLPHTKVRDLDGTTLSLRARGDQSAIERFVRDLRGFRGRRSRIARRAFDFVRRWHGVLSPTQIAIGAFNGALLCAPVSSSAPLERAASRRRTCVSTTEILDGFYRPAFPVAAAYASHFQPTMLTDATGQVNEALEPDLLADRCAAPAASTVQ